MKSTIFFIIGIVSMFGCGYNKRSKKNHPLVTAICNHILYVESYTVFADGGAVGGVVKSDYITDSLNFRLYVGTFDEGHEKYFYECKNDTIYIEKRKFEEDSKSLDASKVTITTLEKKVYSLQALQQKKIFE